MDNNKLDTITNLFEGKEIRSIWDSEKEEYFFSVVDVISALTDSNIPRNYWSDLKRRLKSEGSQLHENIVQLKMKAQDGKMRETDTLDTKGILRLIESVPSEKAEPFKLWLAQMGKERIDEVFDPELAVNRAINYYRNQGYNDKWIEARLKGILDRKKLTDVWKENGIKQNYEYAILTNEIYQSWSGMKANEYKNYKNIRKESLRDNMTDIEVALTDLGEIATRELAKEHKPYGLKANREVAKMGGHAAKVARDDLEKNLGKSVISKENALDYKYINDQKLIVDKKSKENKLTIFINRPIKEVFDYSLESNNVPKWITSIKEEIPEKRPVELGTKLRNIEVDSEQWNTYEIIEFEPPKTFTLKRLNGDYFVKYTCTEKNKGTDFEYLEWAEKENLEDLMEMSALELLKKLIEEQ